MLIDTHCHLDAAEFDADRDAVVAAARAAGVGQLVIPAVEPANFAAVQTLARRHGCAYALGIHPLYVDRAGPEAALQALATAVDQALADHDRHFVAIGEIGLDGFVPDIDPELQRRLFDGQLRIAADRQLPVLLHVRRAQDQVAAGLRRFRPPGGIAHAFNGSFQQADVYLQLGCVLGFGGTLTFPRSQQIRRLAAELPAEALVLETDAPDIPPSWAYRQRNEPAHLPRIADELAGLRSLERSALADVTAANALRVLPRLATLPPMPHSDHCSNDAQAHP